MRKEADGMRLQIIDTIQQFHSIELKDLEGVALLDRIDTKHVINADMIIDLLRELTGNYFILEINGRRCFNYETLYYDTPKSDMFISHLRGKLNRFKVRKRLYADSGDSFLEVKFKNNKKRTIKWRTTEFVDIHEQLEGQSFLSDHIPYNPDNLIPTLESHFQRITLVDHKYTHRVTIDFDLNFRKYASQDNTGHRLPNLAIVEIKTSRGAEKNGIHQKLRDFGIQSVGFSKYCMGRALTDPDFEKMNLLKPKLLRLNKIANANIYNCG